jgi:predicted 3-demethylubiquinone-9 3-methyltransferase (glyoxalase superfamily)
MAKIEQRITPMLWFDNQAEEAANYYVSIFKNSKVTNVSHYGDTGPGPKGSVMVAEFELDGQQFTALNGGPQFKFTEAISLVVNCENQAEVDYYWEKLSGDGGQEVVCGWLKDKYGLSWQVVPVRVFELLSDPATSDRTLAAVMEMKKIELSKIEQAAAAKATA